MDFPEKLKKLRNEKGLTQEELAKSIFVSRTLISKYENGAVYPTKDNAEKLALFFNIPLSELIDENDTVQLTLKSNDTAMKINMAVSCCIISLYSILSLLSLIPFITINYYDYSKGSPPTLNSKIVSPTQLTIQNGNPIVLIALILLLANVASSFISLRFKSNQWIKLCNYLLAVINLFLVFFSIVFTVIYFSNNSIDL